MTATLDVSASCAAVRPGLVQRVVRCLGVSVVSTVVCLSTLLFATVGLGIVAWLANIMATSVATVPSYHLNRRWTWGKRDASNLWREVVPFWLLAFAGLVLSTLAVGVADAWAAGAHLDGSLRTPVVLLAHLSGFGALWVVQFVLLDRVLFAHDTSSDRRTDLPSMR